MAANKPFDNSIFDLPDWAKNQRASWNGIEKNGESSKGPTAFSTNNMNGGKHYQSNGADDIGNNDDGGDQEEDETNSLGLSEQDEIWEDAEEKLGIDPETGQFTVDELKRLLSKGTQEKENGNKHFQSKPPKLQESVECYISALSILPNIPISSSSTDPLESPSHSNGKDKNKVKETVKVKPPPAPVGSGIQELTEEEAEALEKDLMTDENDIETNEEKTEEEQREEVEEEIRGMRKACYGNLGAVYLALGGKDKECVDVCTEALKIDSKYVKALQRRAVANERIGSWSSLTSAQEDYTLLLDLLPASHPQIASTKRSLATLPSRIKMQQDKEKDEMLGKLKELGNGILGRFGLSTDNFKFDQQEGGGYSMRFER